MASTEEEKTGIDVAISSRVAMVTIKNPAKRNAFTRQMCIDLKNTMYELSRAREVDVVTLRGAGEHFSAGASIDQLPSVLFDSANGEPPVDHLSAADQAITEVAKPTVAVVEGFCMGGGWQIASACDFIVASSSAKFAITPSKIGILYPKAGVERLLRLVGPDRAKYILMTAKAFSAHEAHSLGLVADIMDAETFDERVQELLETLLRRSRFSQQKLKEFIDLFHKDAIAADESWASSWQQMLEGRDMRIGIEAFQNQRSPEFTWTPDN